jgi:hypothetical protein
MAWWATVVDTTPGGLNVFEVWRILFPKHRREIDTVWNKIQPEWNPSALSRCTRKKAGFKRGHHDRAIRMALIGPKEQPCGIALIRPFGKNDF